ncbi:MAG TPA: RHS repeat-associated core domain-containing protein [Trueperaceae bacterium]|nr:RHS repeat-associated core domain-containing protein [Trueperaceae bacterium]
MLGTVVHQASMEAGERWMLNDVTGNPIRAWDSRGHNFRTEYDPLRRPLRQFVRGTDAANSDPRTLDREVLVERIEYGEGQTDDVALNLRTRVFKQCDGAGIETSLGSNPASNREQAYDFKGNLLGSRRQLARDFKSIPDWSDAVPLEDDIFQSSTTYDALNRPTTQTAPDGSVIRPTYNEANLLERVEANLGGAVVATPFVTNIDYEANGQRRRVGCGNGVRMTYDYDPLTFRLTRLQTRRGAEALQDLRYTYDPVGNITHIQDDAQQTLFFRNRRVEPSNEYIYDAIYRLIEARGREHLGQVGGTPIPHSHSDAPRVGLKSGNVADQFGPNDGRAMGSYVERYLYDAVGNFNEMQHRGIDPAHSGWTRTYAYGEASLLEPAKQTNRLSSTTVGNGNQITEPYDHDAHGNMTRMPHLPLMRWDFRDQLQATAKQVVGGGAPETTYYVYDASGQRVRKVTERQAAVGETPTRMKERIYLGGFEVFRDYEADGHTVKLERESLHIMDDQQQIALVETRTHGNDGSLTQLIRFQLGNHLSSATLELDEQAEIISYEEYAPYGSTTYQAGRSETEVKRKRYRYTGVERDESGFSYHSARYYSAWLGRWTSADPAGLLDGENLFKYARGNPTRLLDTSGTQSHDSTLWIEEESQGSLTLGERSALFKEHLKESGESGKLSRAEYLAEHANWDRYLTSDEFEAFQQDNHNFRRNYRTHVGFYAREQKPFITSTGEEVILGRDAAVRTRRDHFLHSLQAGAPLQGPGAIVGAPVYGVLRALGRDHENAIGWAQLAATGAEIFAVGSARSAARRRVNSYRGSAGLEVRRDASTSRTSSSWPDVDKFGNVNSRQPKSIQDRLTMESAKRGEGKVKIRLLGDADYYGMQKMEAETVSQGGLKSRVHYVRGYLPWGRLMDFKFTSHSTDYTHKWQMTPDPKPAGTFP